MSNLKSALKRLCSDANITKETYYGTSHRASFSLNGEKAEWDIFHIGIPFTAQKEAELMRRFGLERDDLPAFYGNFEKAVVRHINLLKAMNDSGIQAIKRNVIEYRSVQYYPRLNPEGKQIGQDFYLISNPMDSFVGTEYLKNNGAYLLDINNLAIRLLQAAKTLNENGFSIGAIDLDSCYYVAEEGGKKFIKLGYGFYGASEAISPSTYTEDVRPYIPEEVAAGTEKQSLDTDVQTICAYIWTMLDGRHFTEPNDNAWTALKYYSKAPTSVPANKLPRFAPPELATLLVEGMTRGAEAMRDLQTDIRQINKRISAGELENTFIVFEAPSYLKNPLPPPREVNPAEEAAEEEPTEKEPEKNETGRQNKKKPRAAGFVIAFLAIALLIGVGAYFLIGIDGIRQLMHPVHYSMSANSNVYALNGKVVNDKLQVYAAYAVDEAGNIVKASNPEEIVFPPEYVSEYIFVEDVKLAIVEKEFARSWFIADVNQELREGVVDLRGVPNLIYSYEADAVNEIPKTFLEEYGIEHDSLILIRSDYDNPETFTVVMLVDVPETYEEPLWGSGEVQAENAEAAGNGMEIVLQEESQETKAPMLPVMEVQYFSDSLLYKLQGEWRNKVTISIVPGDAVNSRVTLTSEDPDHMYFVVESEEGTEGKKTKSIRLRSKGDEETSFYIFANTEGKYLIRVESEDGNLMKQIQMSFLPPNDYVVESPPPRPTPAPIPTEAPEPTPTEEPVPTAEPTPSPSPTPWQQEYPSQGTGGGYSGGGYSGGGYSGGGNSGGGYSGGGESTVPTPEPVQPTPVPTQTPVYTPEPIQPLSCSISHVDLAVGETFRLGDYLDGLEGGYLTAIPSPSGIVGINQAEGFLLTGISTGECVITISKGTERIQISVTVA